MAFWDFLGSRNQAPQGPITPKATFKSVLCLFKNPSDYYEQLEGDISGITQGTNHYWQNNSGNRVSAYVVAQSVQTKLEGGQSQIEGSFHHVDLGGIIPKEDTTAYWGSRTTGEKWPRDIILQMIIDSGFDEEIVENEGTDHEHRRIRNWRAILAVGTIIDKEYKEGEKKIWKWAKVIVGAPPPPGGEPTFDDPEISSDSTADGILRGSIRRNG